MAKFDNKETMNILQNNLLAFSHKKQTMKCHFSIKKAEVGLSSIHTKDGMVLKQILKLNLNKSLRSDEMYPQILIELLNCISKALSLLLNKTMDEECIPYDYEMVYISLMELEIKAGNYRHIGLTSIVSKLMESFTKESTNDRYESRKYFFN